jgi:hypothetical protein
LNSRTDLANPNHGILAATAIEHNTLGEVAFHRMISLERRRTKRSRKSFMLMLLDMGEFASAREARLGLRQILSTLSGMLRETDVTGWYREDSVVGVMFTEITLDERNALPATLMARVNETLKSHLAPRQFHQVSISFHLLPEERAEEALSRSSHPAVFSGMSAANGSSF